MLEWVQSTFQFKELLFQTRRDRWMLNSFKSRRRRKQVWGGLSLWSSSYSGTSYVLETQSHAERVISLARFFL